MLSKSQMAALVPEIYTRLCMMEEEWDYEIAVPDRRDLLGLVGGARISEFQAIPIVVNADSSRVNLPAQRFMHRVQGTIDVAGQSHPNIRVVSVEQPHVGLYDWLISDPWNRTV